MNKKIVSIIGLGFVGFPTACILANCKDKKHKDIFKVNGIDKNLDKVKKNILNFNSKSKGLSDDKKLNAIIKNVIKKNKISFSKKIENISNSNIVIVSVSFDFHQSKNLKKYQELKKLFREIGKNIKKNSLILVETTLPPGTCDNVIIPILKQSLKNRKMKLNDIYFSYSYERIMPGNGYMDSIINIHRCYAGMNKPSSLNCKNFLKKFINYKKFPLFEFNKLKDCEASKILENSYRAINIAFIDEWTRYANATNLNLNRIINAIKLRKTHNNIMRPGLGVGGYCLTKDPGFVEFSSKFFLKSKINFPIINRATKINKTMPQTSIEFIKSKVKRLEKKKVIILGASYKNDVSDIRFSPSLDLIKYFKNKKISFKVHDPLAKNIIDKDVNIINTLPRFKNYDVILFCVNHSSYKRIKKENFSKNAIYFDLNQVLNNSQINFMNKNNFKLEILGGNY
tara:strand:+ start:1783 stop:3147 length:1365 start_codon:yes stop_codon:yes gene_type:complete